MISCKEPIKKIKDGSLPVFLTFDIETTTLTDIDPPLAFMYIWQLCVGNERERAVYYGRTWREYIQFLDKLRFIYGRGFVCYVFNLGYEFQFLRSVIPVTDMFATRKRVPVRFKSVDIEYRCAYKLTNMSLAKFIESEGVAHQKLTYDYRKIRYSDTPLSDDELAYCENDVLGFHEALCRTMLKGSHNLKSVPYTSTGYVRREARAHMQSNYRNRFVIDDMKLDAHMYKLCKAASRGGNTHANYIHSNTILKNVKSYDIVSSYPWTMLVSDKFPMSQFVRTDMDIDNKRAHLLLLALYNVKMYQGVYIPYIARAKCQVCVGNVICDNGRIVTADKIILACTEIDYFIILRQYRATIEVVEHYTAKRGRLPKEYREYVAEMYRGKCELKGVDPYMYGKYKNKYNSLFGLMLTDITQADITYSDGEWGESVEPVQKLLDDFYKKKSSFLSYQWGLYVTAIARERLQEALDLVGEDVVYCDTDSVKYIGNHDEDFACINEHIHDLNMSCDIEPYITVNGVYNELGLFECDDNYDEFKTLGAKKYAYRHGDRYGVTVSGLNKKLGAEYISTHGGLDSFSEGTIFDNDWSGRLTAHYDDRIRLEALNINGHMQEITSNVALVETTYTLGIGRDYKNFLENYENYVDKE